MSQILETIGGLILFGFLLGCVGWLFWRTLKRSYDPGKVLLKLAVTIPFVIFCFWIAHQLGPFGPFVIVFLGVVMSIMWTPHISEWLFKPLTNLIDGGDEPPEPKPYYSTAQAKRMRREFLEAVVAVREQLAHFPNDMEGVMLLATIQAEDLQDLLAAEMTLNHFCDRPDAPPRQVAAAMDQLADWHIRLAQDFDSARAAFEKIVARFPGTELSLQAAQRIAHLGGTEKRLLASLDRQPMAVPEGIKNVGLLKSSEHLRPAEMDPEQLAAVHVKHLEQHPLDAEVREKLAVIYANHYKRLDLATLELEQLIEQPNQPTKHVAHWLNLLADLQIQLGADYETVRPTLEKIAERFPGLYIAELARTRLDRLKLEMKGQKETPGVKLGVYEQNIGLKYGSPRQL
jgi:cbb3-type cytochrome oxidase subunit 3/tetratricopeptide (TPR) repeat protein